MGILQAGNTMMSPAMTPAANPQPIVTTSGYPVGSRVIIMGDQIFTATDSRGNTYVQRPVGAYINFCDALVTTALQTGDTITITRSGSPIKMRYHITAWTGIDPKDSFHAQTNDFFTPNGPPSTLTNLQAFLAEVPRNRSLMIVYYLMTGYNGVAPTISSYSSGFINGTPVYETGGPGVQVHSIDWQWTFAARSIGSTWIGATCSPALDDGQWATVCYKPSQNFFTGA